MISTADRTPFTVARWESEQSSVSTAQSALSELIGTCFLMLAALLAPPHLTALAVGATLLVFAVAVGKVSGAHLDPAVTAACI